MLGSGLQEDKVRSPKTSYGLGSETPLMPLSLRPAGHGQGQVPGSQAGTWVTAVSVGPSSMAGLGEELGIEGLCSWVC